MKQNLSIDEKLHLNREIRPDELYTQTEEQRDRRQRCNKSIPGLATETPKQREVRLRQ